MTKTIKEGPEWGAESAAAYKADTPGQEDSTNIPYKSEDDIVNDDIKKMIEIISKKVRGLKEHIVRHYTQWPIIESYLDKHGTLGIEKLVEDATMKNVSGKPLRSVVEEVELEEDTQYTNPNLTAQQKDSLDRRIELAKKNRPVSDSDTRPFIKRLPQEKRTAPMPVYNKRPQKPGAINSEYVIEEVSAKLVEATRRMTPWDKMVKNIPELKKRSEEAEAALRDMKAKENKDPQDVKEASRALPPGMSNKGWNRPKASGWKSQKDYLKKVVSQQKKEETPEERKKNNDEMMDRIRLRHAQTTHAGRIPVKEENINEISDKKVDDYEKKAQKDLANKSLAGGPKNEKSISKRYTGLSAVMRRKAKKEKTGDKAQDDYDGANREGKKAGSTRYVGD